ncbi:MULTISPECIES: M28 family peptidase [unclassified Moraxella]|uniref:M28 family peptidase n=1 Tax=unclassified Moraxella TaxID=2685852 RepID=UPI003AF5AEA1
MKTKLSSLSTAVLFGLTSLVSQQALADYGDYGKQTAIDLAEQYAGRYTGTEQEVKASKYVEDRMRIAGSKYQPTRQDYSFVAKRGVLAKQTLNSSNIIVEQAGTGNTGKTLYVGAHYDSNPSNKTTDRSTLQGLDDNASGLGVLTELVKNLSQIQTLHNVKFVAFSGEEYGLEGSKSFVNSLSDSEKQNAIGMINLDSLITGDHMYANTGDKAYDKTAQKVVPQYAALRENAEAIAKSLGIDLQKNEGDLIAEEATEPYKPYGVGCCSDHESFDEAGMPVVAFEATNWRLGPEFDGYTQTDNPKIPDGSTWHQPAEDNKQFLTNALGEERINQRMRDFSKIVTRLIVEQTGADVQQANFSAIEQQNKLAGYLHKQIATTQSNHGVFERANYLASNVLTDNTPNANRVWFDANQSYQDTAINGEGTQAQLGLYGEHAINPQWAIGAGIEANHYKGENDSPVRKDTGYGVKLYSIYASPLSAWWNTTLLGYGKHELDTNRSVTLGGQNGTPVIIDNLERGNLDANVLSVSTETGYNFLNRPNYKHGVYVGTNYSDINFDSYTSGDKSRTALNIGETDAQAWDAEVGYQIQSQFAVANKPVKIKAKLGYVNVIDEPVVDSITTKTFDGVTHTLNYKQDDLNHYGRFGLGLSSNLAKGTWAYLNGETTFAKDNDSDDDYSVQVGIQHEF